MQESQQQALPQNEQHEPENPLEQPPSTNKGLGVLFIATIALIIAIACLVLQYFFWKMHQQNRALLIAQSQQYELSIQPKIQQLQNQLHDQQRSINSLLSRNQQDERRNTLVLAREAEYLITLAQYNLAYQGNVELAAKLLVQADQKLAQISDTAVNALRRSINNDVTTLNLTPKIDISALVARLSAMSDQVATLSNLPAIPKPRQLKPVPVQLTWKQKLMEILNSLRGVVTIRRLPETVRPLASPQQQIYIVQGIQLQFAQAIWAVLHQNATLYQNSLTQAIKELEIYYPRNQKAAQLVNLIKQLQAVNIRPSLPDLTNTLTLLQSFIRDTEQAIQQASGAKPPAAGMVASPQPPGALPS